MQCFQHFLNLIVGGKLLCHIAYCLNTAHILFNLIGYLIHILTFTEFLANQTYQREFLSLLNTLFDALLDAIISVKIYCTFHTLYPSSAFNPFLISRYVSKSPVPGNHGCNASIEHMFDCVNNIYALLFTKIVTSVSFSLAPRHWHFNNI